MKLYEIFVLLLLGMLIFMPIALIVFLPKLSNKNNKDTDDRK